MISSWNLAVAIRHYVDRLERSGLFCEACNRMNSGTGHMPTTKRRDVWDKETLARHRPCFSKLREYFGSMVSAFSPSTAVTCGGYGVISLRRDVQDEVHFVRFEILVAVVRRLLPSGMLGSYVPDFTALHPQDSNLHMIHFHKISFTFW
jgi:hypothetical protein